MFVYGVSGCVYLYVELKGVFLGGGDMGGWDGENIFRLGLRYFQMQKHLKKTYIRLKKGKKPNNLASIKKTNHFFLTQINILAKLEQNPLLYYILRIKFKKFILGLQLTKIQAT